MIRLSELAQLYHADCRDVIRIFPDNSIDSFVSDPPYALVSVVKRFGGANAAPAKGNDAYMRASAGFMGKTWDTGETAFSVEFWAEVFRVLKPGAFVAAFGASRGYHRMACAIEDAGFEIRDSLMWCYGTGFPKSHDVSKGIDAKIKTGSARTEDIRKLAMGDEYEPSGRGRVNYDHGGGSAMNGAVESKEPLCAQAAEWEGWGTALKPAFEPIVLARKPLSEGTVAANVLRWRTGALNIDACRVGTTESLNGGAYAKSGGRKTLAGDERNGAAAGMFQAGKTAEAAFAQPEGRWPANVVHDGSDEVVGAFPSTAPAKRGVRDPNGSMGYHGGASGLPGVMSGHSDAGGSAARFFYSAKASKADRNGSKHPTVKPIALMEWLAKLITPPGGTVLDPFAGSGTTGIAATRNGFSVVLCEREAEYIEDIKSRFGFIPDAPSIVPPCPIPAIIPAPPY